MTPEEYKHKEDIITMTEVTDKFDAALASLITLENTIRCFNRTWNCLTTSPNDLVTITSFLQMLEINFINTVNSQLSYSATLRNDYNGGGDYNDSVGFN